MSENDLLLQKVLDWAESSENIRAVVLTGSTARAAQSPDGLSDLDIELYASDPETLLEDDAWFRSQFGELLAVEALPNPGWHPTRLLYLVGAKIDFMIASVGALHEATYDRPFRVLVDKDGLANDLSTRQPASHAPPSGDDFDRCWNWFFAAALMEAKALRRSEPWGAKVRDWDLHKELLRMIEWDHKARYGWAFETWWLGKYMQDWMDADVRAALDGCWADFSPEHNRAALLACLDLFERLSERTARTLGCPAPPVEPVRQEVHRILGRGLTSS